MLHPKISIIIPTYNAGATLADCLKSVIDQNYPNLEVIVIDGLSDDCTMRIANQFCCEYSWLRVISEPDAGIYDAMNKGLRIATGNWVLFLGSDDTLHDTSVLSDVSKKLMLTKAQGLYGDALIRGDTSWAKDGDIYDGEFTLEKLLSKNICHQTIFYRNSFLRRIGEFNISYGLCADWDLNLRCISKGEFVYWRGIIVNFNAGGATTKNENDVSFSRDFVKNVMLYFHFDAFHPIFEIPSFPRRDEVALMQRRRNLFRWLLNRVKKRLSRKLWK